MVCRGTTLSYNHSIPQSTTGSKFLFFRQFSCFILFFTFLHFFYICIKLTSTYLDIRSGFPIPINCPLTHRVVCSFHLQAFQLQVLTPPLFNASSAASFRTFQFRTNSTTTTPTRTVIIRAIVSSLLFSVNLC